MFNQGCLMIRQLLKKTLRESALLFAACWLMLLLFCWARVWILCQFDLQRFEPVLDQFRAFERFLPVPLEQLLTYQGGLAMTFHEPVLLLCILVWSVARGSDVVSGEINRGTLEMLLAQPISRLQLLLCHSLVCTVGLALLCFAVWLGLYFGIHSNSIREQATPTVELSVPYLPIKIPVKIGATRQVQTPLSARVAPTVYAAPTCNLFGLGFLVLALSVACSSFDRYRWRTLGIVISVYVVQLLLLMLSKATPAMAWCGYLTFLSAYRPDSMVHFARHAPADAWRLTVPAERLTASWPHGLGPLGMTGLMIGSGLLLFGLAAWRLRSRDIPAPL